MEKPSLDTAKAGAIRFNTDLSQLEIYDGNQWTGISGTSPEQQTGGTRGLFYSGADPSSNPDDVIQFINIDTAGNATDFGNANVSSLIAASFSSRTRSFKAGGSSPSMTNSIEFVTISSQGNGTNFGDLTNPKKHCSGISNSTRGVIGPGEIPGSPRHNSIDYITMSSSGDAVDFGDSTKPNQMGSTGGLASPTRGLFCGGSIPSTPVVATIDFITISTLSNASDFGDLQVAQERVGSCSNAVRGIVTSGAPSASNLIQFLTIATLGNATDFGDATTSSYGKAGVSSPTRAVFGSAYGPAATDVIDYVKIMTLGNAVDFGNLLANRMKTQGSSNGHGGL
jgi:hypothetical protein